MKNAFLYLLIENHEEIRTYYIFNFFDIKKILTNKLKKNVYLKIPKLSLWVISILNE